MMGIGPADLHVVLSKIFAAAESPRDGQTFDEKTWSHVVAGGFDRLLVPESLDGAGGGMDSLAAVLVAAGYAASLVPISEASLARGVCARLGHALPPGLVTMHLSRLALPESGEIELPSVAYARHARLIVVVGPEAGGRATLHIGDLTGHEIKVGSNIAGEPRDHVVLLGNSLTKLGFLPSFVELAGVWSAARSLLLCGALQRARELTLSYALQREQFGGPLMRFQAVQGLVVEVVTGAEMATALARRMVEELAWGSSPTRRDLVIRAASVVARRAALQSFRAAHQVHGAIGLTDEYPLHQTTRRLLAWRDEYAPGFSEARDLGSWIRSAGLDEFWDAMTAPSPNATDGGG